MTSSKRVFVVFVDGVGLGTDDAEVNPFVRYKPNFLQHILDGNLPISAKAGYSSKQATLLGLDATLGIEGLPQSGTGQTAILTGLNVAKTLGKHYGPYPNLVLKELLATDSLFQHVLDRQIPVAYASAYPNQFLDRLKRGKGRLSANTRAALLAGLKLRGINELQAGRAISGLITNKYWQQWGYDVPLLTAEVAGKQFIDLGKDHRLVFFEFWYTDVVGHKQDMVLAKEVIRILDGFLNGAVEAMDLSNSLLLVISDHGNFEDMSTKKHTRNPALTLVFGEGHEKTSGQLISLMDIKGFILDTLQ